MKYLLCLMMCFYYMTGYAEVNKGLLHLQQASCMYIPGKPADPVNYRPTNDAGRIRYLPFFEKMYGSSEKEVRQNLTIIYWMPKFFGKKYPLPVTTVNGVDKHLRAVSVDLEKLLVAHPEYKKFLQNPGGTFLWRKVAGTNYLSPHSFGIAMDINTDFSNYWEWDLKKAHRPVSEKAKLGYENHIPWEIVLIFEKHGFIWGGKWIHYDTMHFEYRPEFFLK